MNKEVFLNSVFIIICCIQVNYAQVKLPKNYTSEIDVVYTLVNNWEGKMDLYISPNAIKPTPILINIHGGGWNHGEKESQTGFGSFFKNGYAVANIEYRLVEKDPAPAAIEDVRCALIYLYKNAKKLNIDTHKIVLMGGSSGGHLALMAGFLGNNSIFDSNCKYNEPIKVAAIIDKYGVSDLEPLLKWKSAINWIGKEVGNDQFVKSVSPINYVTKNSPPVFIVHGNDDPIVPYSQSLELAKKLRSFGVKTKFITVPNGKHGKFSDEEKRKVNIQMWNFLDDLDLKKKQ